MTLRLLALFPLLFFTAVFSHPQADHSQQEIERAHQVLHEAAAHLDVLPEKTLSLIQENQDVIKVLDQDRATRWYFTQFDAALKLADTVQMEHALTGMLSLQHAPFFLDHIPKVANSLGVWFRRNGHYEQARLSYICSVIHATQPKEKWRALSNLAVVARNQGKLEEAELINLQVLDNADDKSQHILRASVQNNLGIVYLSQGKPDLAADRFRLAMDSNQRNMRRASEILNGINLLLTFYQQGDADLFDRLFPRIDRLLSQYPESARHAYLRLIYQLNEASTGRLLNSETRTEMEHDYEKVNDTGIQALIYSDLASFGLNIDKPTKPVLSDYDGALLDQMPLCPWPELQQMDATALIDDVILDNNG